MQKSDFHYELPPELIAQTPLVRRDASRLLCLSRSDGGIRHAQFTDLPDLLRPGDLLVINDSRVLPARLLGVLEGTNVPCEVLLLRDYGEDVWECIVRPGRRLRAGAAAAFGGGLLTANVESILENGNRMVRFACQGDLLGTLAVIGEMPLPPYIREKLGDPERYQTVYAKNAGSAAAPTAGLHFTPELLDTLAARGIHTAAVTLHVGLGTFRPMTAERVEDHIMHSEVCALPEDTLTKITQTQAAGGRIIAVGTTSCRTLESFALPDGSLCAGHKDTSLYITPGFQFRVIDGLITNFHLPESTLIMLVSALAGRENVLAAYREAVKERYRFFSFGDCMIVI
jgi:S-adenosylmethionine:tRNA ribosyltransferase-isomerase